MVDTLKTIETVFTPAKEQDGIASGTIQITGTERIGGTNTRIKSYIRYIGRASNVRKNLNDDLLQHIVNKINDCPAVKDGCIAGDSGEVHCILCKHNILSTEELVEV